MKTLKDLIKEANRAAPYTMTIGEQIEYACKQMAKEIMVEEMIEGDLLTTEFNHGEAIGYNSCRDKLQQNIDKFLTQ